MACKHKHLHLIVENTNRLRCNVCHLTIDADELKDSFCPECHALSGKRNYDFTRLETEAKKTVKYRCEKCRLVIEC